MNERTDERTNERSRSVSPSVRQTASVNQSINQPTNKPINHPNDQNTYRSKKAHGVALLGSHPTLQGSGIGRQIHFEEFSK